MKTPSLFFMPFKAGFPGTIVGGINRGVAIFAKACFGHPSPSKRQKLNATALAFGAPAVLLLSFHTQQGV
ncbi:MAG: hypothetical protein ACXWUC_11510, partial [Methylosarcina sp.]